MNKVHDTDKCKTQDCKACARVFWPEEFAVKVEFKFDERSLDSIERIKAQGHSVGPLAPTRGDR